jgi:hypothetical protein
MHLLFSLCIVFATTDLYCLCLPHQVGDQVNYARTDAMVQQVTTTTSDDGDSGVGRSLSLLETVQMAKPTIMLGRR